MLYNKSYGGMNAAFFMENRRKARSVFYHKIIIERLG